MVIINSFRYPESDIRCQQRDVRAIIDKKDLGIGTLYVSEQTLCWHLSDNVGLTVEYPNISLHAISKDSAVYPEKCLYIMLDGHISMPGEDSQPIAEDSDNSDAESVADISELLLVPANTEVIEEIYDAIKICQELNPDPLDMEDEDEDDSANDDNLYVDAEAEMGEDHQIMERGGGDADVEDITRRFRDNLPDVQINLRNGHDEEEFQDAD